MKRLVLATLLLSTPVMAAEVPAPRTIDMTTVITDIHGKPIPDGSQITSDDPRCEKCTPLTLGTVVASSLLADRKDEPNLSTVDKAKRGTLAMRLIDDKEAVLTPPQITEIERLMTIWTPLVVARALPMIDPATDISGK